MYTLRTAAVAGIAAVGLLAGSPAAQAADQLAGSQTDQLGGGSWVRTDASVYKSSLYATTTVHNAGQDGDLAACVRVRFLGKDGVTLIETPEHRVVAAAGQPDTSQIWYEVVDYDAVLKSANLQIAQRRC
jgi:hypothetical protein